MNQINHLIDAWVFGQVIQSSELEKDPFFILTCICTLVIAGKLRIILNFLKAERVNDERFVDLLQA